MVNHENFPFKSAAMAREMSIDSAGNRSLNARYKPGGSEYEGTGTATPADQRYLLHQRHENTTTPVYGLSQHEAPDIGSYRQIEEEHQSFLHELNITSNYPRLPYQVRAEKDKQDVIHFGQLKLLLSEIRFLTEFNELGKVVVYAGAAPGHHIGYLAELFPEHRFELYDPCEFSKSLDGHDRIAVHREYFTNSLAAELGTKWKEEGVLFISDIRTADHRQMTEEENEACIMKDNEWQKQWVQAMKPKKAMLKFRCPYPDRIAGPSQYLDGQIWIQSFNRRSGTETRLIPKEGDDCSYTTMREYDHRKYEEQLFFFNEKIRKCYVYNEHYDSSFGFENNWDCWSYGYLLERYLFYVVGMEVDETEDIFKTKKVIEHVHAISNALRVNINWLRTKQNAKEDYWNNYDMVDHRHFHDLNSKKSAIPLPQMVRARSPRRNRKRTFSEMQDGDGADPRGSGRSPRGNLESLRYVDPKVQAEADLSSDPIGWIKRIATKFPNPDAWRERISELVGSHLEGDGDGKGDGEGKDVIDRLFRYLDPKGDENEVVVVGDDGCERLNGLQAVLCVNRMYTVLIVQIPPNAKGLVNDSKFTNKYPIYGLRNTAEITSAVLSPEVRGLYLFGKLSHDRSGGEDQKELEAVEKDGNEKKAVTQADGGHKVTFKLSQIVGINDDFVAVKRSDSKEKFASIVQGVTQSVLAIDCSDVTFVK